MRRNLLCPFKKWALWCVCLLAIMASAVVLTARTASAQDDETFSAVADMPIPNPGSYFFDISYVDPRTDLYLVTNSGNKSVDVYQASTRTYLFSVPGFTGVMLTSSGPNLNNIGPDGVLTTSPTEAWAGDGDSTVKVIDLISRSITDVISTGGKARADEMAYDRRDGVLIITNPGESSVDPIAKNFVTLISTKTHKILKQIFFSPALGLEQPSWSRDTDLFYISVPTFDGTLTNTGVLVIDPRKLEVVDTFNEGDCGPLGSAIGPDFQMLLGCGGGPGTFGETFIIDIRNGHIIKKFFDVGNPDEVWYNPGDGHYFISANAFGPTPTAYLGVIDAETLQFDPPLVPTAPISHSVAANPATNQVFVPISGDPSDPNCTNGCVRVYVASGRDRDDRIDEGHNHERGPEGQQGDHEGRQ